MDSLWLRFVMMRYNEVGCGGRERMMSAATVISLSVDEIVSVSSKKYRKCSG